MSDVVPWRRDQFSVGGKEMFEVDKGRFPMRQCADRGRLSLRAFPPKTTASPCLPQRRLLVFKRLVESLQRDWLCQWSGRRGSNPRQPAWKADRREIAARLFSSGFRRAFIDFKRHPSAVEADGRLHCEADGCLPLPQYYTIFPRATSALGKMF